MGPRVAPTEIVNSGLIKFKNACTGHRDWIRMSRPWTESKGAYSSLRDEYEVHTGLNVTRYSSIVIGVSWLCT